jgi:predicted dienelactone hydrolase
MDTFVLKYDTAGQLLWARGISGAADEQGRGIAADPTGNVLVVGEFTGTIELGATSLTAASDERDIFVAKYDPDGTLLWARRYGATGEDYARGVGTDAQGYIYVTGVFSDEVAFGQTWLRAPSTREQLFLMRLAPNGTVVWAQGMTGSGQGHGCEIEVTGYGDSVIACDVMGELQFGGRSVSSLGTRDSVLARFSSAGAVLWVKPLGADSDAASFALALDPSGEFVTSAGVYQGNIGNNGYRVTSVPESSSYIVRLDERLIARSDAIDDLPAYGLAQAGPYAVAEIELTLPANGWPEPVALRLYVPEGSGPFPIVFFVSGTGATNDTFPETSRFLASHGYVVLHNSYTRDDSLGDEELWRMRAEGVSFVLDSLDTIVQLEPTLAGKLDSGAIGAMGHSSGAYITQLVGGSIVIWDGIAQSFRDPRIDAFIMYSGQGSDQQGLTTSSWDNLFIPMMQMSGTEDEGALEQDPSWRWEPYLYSPPGDKYMGWYYGGTHGSFSGDFVIDPIAQARFEHGQTMTLAFWDAYLKASPEAKAFLRSRAPASLAVTPVDFATK